MVKLRGNSNGKRQAAAKPDQGEDGFWDRPILINLLADLLLLGAGVLLAWSGTVALQRLPVFPLTQLLVVTPPERVSRAQIENVARGALLGNFFTVNLDTAKTAFERMPWVRTASLRRRWPDGIELVLEEQHAVARWTPQEGEMRLVNTLGEVFMAYTQEMLPSFVGPEGSAPRVLARFREFNNGLAAIGRKPVAVILSAREAWQLKLDDGLELELGRDRPKHPIEERLSRFTAHYPSVSSLVASRLQTVGVVDMRYPNGFALRANKS